MPDRTIWLMIVTSGFGDLVEVPKTYFYKDFEVFKKHLRIRKQRIADLIDKGGYGDVSYFEFDNGTWHMMLYDPLDL